jgi:hypothetical protein
VLESPALFYGDFCMNSCNADSDEAMNQGNEKLTLHRFNFFYIMFIHTKEKKIQCRYESPREETREEHGRLAVSK